MHRTESSFSAGSSQPSDTPHSTRSVNGTNLSRLSSISSRDVALYGLGHGLVPIINDPTVQSHLNPVWCWPFGGGSDSFTTPPSQPHGVVYEVTLQNFRRYMRVMADKYDKFEANLQSIALDTNMAGELHGQGEGLAQALRQVPMQYFTEEFDLTRPHTWQEICPSEQEEERQEVMDQLAGYLDVVETHLLRDIAARSENFFQAASVVQDLRGVLARSYMQVKALRHDVHSLDEEVLEAAVTVQKLQRRRSNLKGLVHRLQAIEHVAHSQDALQLLLPQGDFAGALDIMDDIQSSLQKEGLQHLHCFRHLPQQLAQAEEAVQEMMASDLLALLRFQALPQLQDDILAALMQQQEYSASGQMPQQGDYRIQSDDGGTSDRQLGAGGPSADGLTKLLESASGSLQQQPEEMDQLIEMATPLVLGLRRTNSLVAALKDFKEAAAMEVKQAIRDAVEQTLPVLLGEQWAALQHHSLADKLQATSLEGFMQLLAAVLCVTRACLQHCSKMRSVLEEGLRAGRTPRTQWPPLLDQTQEAAQAISEVASGRWAKLLGSRTAATNEAPVPGLKGLLDLCHIFVGMTEAFGCRSSLAMRNAVQLQCKAHLDHLHHKTLTNLTGLLEQEVWAIVQVPAASQLTVDTWLQQAATLKAERTQPSATSSRHSSRTASDSGEAETASTEAPRPPMAPHSPLASTSGRPPTHASPPGHASSRHEADTLHISGQGYHVAHTVLLLLRMQQTYLSFRGAVPLLAAETARRATDLLKVFNSRMCQLVLGAGAMQVSGLRSITAKHLALSSQCLSVFMALHPVLKSLFTASLPAPQRGLLLPELDRLLQDLSMHKEEIHSKLVAIMRERLSTSLKQLPAVAMSWGAQGAPTPSHVPPSAFAQTNAKQLRVLSQVLSPILLQSDLHSIFGRVAALFSKSLTEAFSRLEPRGMAWEAQCSADVRHLLHTLEQLPMDTAQAAGNVQPLLHLSNTRFAAVPSQPTLSAQSAKVDSSKSLHRSLTDVDAARRQQQHAASPPGHAQSNGMATAHQHQQPQQTAAAPTAAASDRQIPETAAAPQQDSTSSPAAARHEAPNDEGSVPQEHQPLKQASPAAPASEDTDSAPSEVAGSRGEAIEEHPAELLSLGGNSSATAAVQSEDSIQAEAILMQDEDMALSSSIDGDIDIVATGGSHDVTVPVKSALTVSTLGQTI